MVSVNLWSAHVRCCCPPQVAPQIAETASVIFAHYIEVGAGRDELVANFKRSVRGSIRQAPNVITWLLTLNNLKKDGDQGPEAISRHWNTKVNKANQLLGKKAYAVKLMTEKLPKQPLDLLVGFVGHEGWENQPFHDDGLASNGFSKSAGLGGRPSAM